MTAYFLNERCKPRRNSQYVSRFLTVNDSFLWNTNMNGITIQKSNFKVSVNNPPFVQFNLLNLIEQINFYSNSFVNYIIPTKYHIGLPILRYAQSS